MKPFPKTSAYLAAARRIIWFQPPEVSLDKPIELLTYAMRYATAEDMALLLKHAKLKGLGEAIDARLPGIVDNRSWAYWSLKAGRTATALPKRTLPARLPRKA